MRASQSSWFLVQGQLSAVRPALVRWETPDEYPMQTHSTAAAKGNLRRSARNRKRLLEPAATEDPASTAATTGVHSSVVAADGGAAEQLPTSTSRSLAAGRAACVVELRSLNASQSQSSSASAGRVITEPSQDDTLTLFVAPSPTVAPRKPAVVQLPNEAPEELQPLAPLLALVRPLQFNYRACRAVWITKFAFSSRSCCGAFLIELRWMQVPWESGAAGLTRAQQRTLTRNFGKAGTDFSRAVSVLLRSLRDKRYVCAVRGEKNEGGGVELHMLAMFDPAQAAESDKDHEAATVEEGDAEQNTMLL